MNIVQRFRLRSPRYFLSSFETKTLSDKIDEFEKATGCELVFHFRKTLGENPLAHAEQLFHKFKLSETRHGAAILIVLSFVDRKYAVYVDKNVKKKSADDFWVLVGQSIARKLKEGSRLESLVTAVDMMQESLKNSDFKFDESQDQRSLSNRPITEDED